jgi:hypothetical protein
LTLAWRAAISASEKHGKSLFWRIALTPTHAAPNCRKWRRRNPLDPQAAGLISNGNHFLFI